MRSRTHISANGYSEVKTRIRPLWIAVVLSIWILNACTKGSVMETGTKGSNVVYMFNNQFYPPVITIPRGSFVTWKNQEEALHTVTGDQGQFVSGDFTRGEVFNHAFTVSGTFYYHCEYHPWVTGTVVVE